MAGREGARMRLRKRMLDVLEKADLDAGEINNVPMMTYWGCLLYTSDAADE